MRTGGFLLLVATVWACGCAPKQKPSAPSHAPLLFSWPTDWTADVPADYQWRRFDKEPRMSFPFRAKVPQDAVLEKGNNLKMKGGISIGCAVVRREPGFGYPVTAKGYSEGYVTDDSVQGRSFVILDLMRGKYNLLVSGQWPKGDEDARKKVLAVTLSIVNSVDWDSIGTTEPTRGKSAPVR